MRPSDAAAAAAGHGSLPRGHVCVLLDPSEIQHHAVPGPGAGALLARRVHRRRGGAGEEAASARNASFSRATGSRSRSPPRRSTPPCSRTRISTIAGCSPGSTAKVSAAGCTAPPPPRGRPIVLEDSARLQEETAQLQQNGIGGKAGKPGIPKRRSTAPRTPVRARPASRRRYGEAVRVAEGIEATFYNVGHVLGAPSFGLSSADGGQTAIVFSGDVGRWNMPILPDPPFRRRPITCRRIHLRRPGPSARAGHGRNCRGGGQTGARRRRQPRDPDLRPRTRAGRSLLPRPAAAGGKIPHLMISSTAPWPSTSPKSSSAIPNCMTPNGQARRRTQVAVRSSRTQVSRTTQESKAINHIRGSCIIMSGAGMCTGGRIKHHLTRNITRPESTILFVGYQAEGRSAGRSPTARRKSAFSARLPGPRARRAA